MISKHEGGTESDVSTNAGRCSKLGGLSSIAIDTFSNHETMQDAISVIAIMETLLKTVKYESP